MDRGKYLSYTEAPLTPRQMVPEFDCCVDADGLISLEAVSTEIPGRIVWRFVKRLRKALLEQRDVAGLILDLEVRNCDAR